MEIKERQKQNSIDNVIKITKYDDEDLLSFYFEKIKNKVIHFCKIEELSAPLFDFIEEKLIVIAQNELEKKKLLENNVSGTINGIELKNIKTISRGDTSITLKENNDINKTSAGSLEYSKYTELTKEDMKVLSRHRKIFWE